MTFWRDLSPFFGDFAIAATVTDLSGASAPVRGILDRERLEYSPGDFGSRVRSERVTLLCPSDELPAALGKGWAVTVDGATYSVLDRAPNGDGTTTIYLETV